MARIQLGAGFFRMSERLIGEFNVSPYNNCKWALKKKMDKGFTRMATYRAFRIQLKKIPSWGGLPKQFSTLNLESLIDFLIP
jgi:hypothetical protein